MPIIKVERIKEHTHWPLQYSIYLDNVEMEIIGNDETKDIEVAGGLHTIYVENGSKRSEVLSFEINESETKVFRVSVAESVKNGIFLGRILYLVMVVSVPFVMRNGPSIIVIFIIIIFTLFAYEFSQKDKYFSLVEIEP